MFNKLKQFLTNWLDFSECKKCERRMKCDHKPYIHRVEDNCNYGKTHGK